MLDLVQDDADERSASAASREAPERLPARDWSNVVFSMAFCEEARRAYENRAEVVRQGR